MRPKPAADLQLTPGIVCRIRRNHPPRDAHTRRGRSLRKADVDAPVLLFFIRRAVLVLRAELAIRNRRDATRGSGSKVAETMTDFEALLSTLSRHEVAFIVVGGAAAMCSVSHARAIPFI